MPKKKTIKEVDYKNAFVPLAGEEDVMIPKKVLEINKRGVHKIVNTLTNKGNLRKANKKYVVHLVPSDNFVIKKSAKVKSTSIIRDIQQKFYDKFKDYNNSLPIIDSLEKEIKRQNSLTRPNKKKIDELENKLKNEYVKRPKNPFI